MVPTIVLNPWEAWGVKAALEISKRRLERNVGIVARRVIERASVGKSVPIWTSPDLARLDGEVVKAHTM